MHKRDRRHRGMPAHFINLVAVVAVISSWLFAASPGSAQVSAATCTAPAAGYMTVVCSDSPVAYWRLDESTGTTVADSTSYGNNGTIVGGVTLGAAGVAGDSAASFDGSTGYINLQTPSSNWPVGSHAYSLEAWMYLTNGTNRDGIIGWGNYSGGGQVNAFRTAPPGEFSQYGSLDNYWWANDLQAPTNSLTGAWHHVVATYDGTTRTIYLDGVQVGYNTPTPPNVGLTKVTIGVTNGGEYFTGTLDEVAVYNYALTSSQVSAHYQAGTPSTSATVSPASGNYRGTTTLTATLTSGSAPLAGQSVTFTVNGTSAGTATTDKNGVASLTNVSLAGINAGTYMYSTTGNTGVAASFASTGGYQGTTAGNTLTVNQAPLTITAVNQAMPYGSTALPSLTYQVGGVIPPDTQSQALPTGPTCTTTATAYTSGTPGSGSHFGTYDISCLGGTPSANYTIPSTNYVKGQLSVTAVKLTISADNQTITVGDAVPAFTWSGSGWANGDSNSTLSATGNTAPTCTANDSNGKPVSSSTPAGKYAITCTGAADNDYAISYQAGTLTINPAQTIKLVVTAPSSAPAGQQVNVHVTAEDASGATVTGYTGTVQLTSTDSQVQSLSHTFVASDNGTYTFTPTVKTAGNQEFTAADSAGGAVSGTSNAVAVSAGSASKLVVTGPRTATAGTGADFTVTAQDQYGNTATGYTGTVHFTSTDAQATLPTDYQFTATDAGMHTSTADVTFTKVGSQTVTAADTSSTSGVASGTSSAVAVGPGPASTFVVTNTAAASDVAGTAFDVTVAAQDAYGNSATGYRGTVHFTSKDTQAALPADYTFTAADNGSHTFTNSTTLKTAGNQTVTAADASNTGVSGSTTVNVVAAALAHLGVTGPSTAVTAGSTFNLTITAQDTYGNAASGTVTLTSTDQQGVMPGSHTFTTSDAGTYTFTNALLKTAGPQTVTATSGNGVSGSASVTVNPGSAIALGFGQQPTGTTVGTTITPAVTVQVQDAYGNAVSSSVPITLAIANNPGSASLSGTLTQNASNGVATFGDLSLNKSGTGYTLAASSSGLTTAISGAFNIDSAPATNLLVVPSVNSTTAGAAFSVTVTAQDANGATVTSYAGTIHFSSTDGNAVLPADYTFNSATDAGKHTFTGVALHTAGSQSIVATNGTISFTSTPISVSAAAVSQLTISAPSTAVAGTPITAGVKATDTYGNVVSNYAGTVHFSSSDAAATLPANTTLSNGSGSFPVTFGNAASQSLTVNDTTNTKLTASVNPAINVGPGPASQFVLNGVPSQVAAGQSFTLTVTAKDAYGNVATGYTGSVQVTSTDPSATLPSNSTLSSGIGSFAVTLKSAGGQKVTLADAGVGSPTATTSSILVDATAPVIAVNTGSYTPNTWTNGNVSVSWTVADPDTGVAASTGCTSTTLSAETAGTTLTCSATNGVGMSASKSVTIQIDKTKPTLTGTPTTQPNAAGWYNGNVSIAWTCVDPKLTSGENGSGIAGACPGNSTITGEGSGLTTAASISDNAGNSTVASSASVNIDRTAPLTSAVAPSGWNNSTVTVTLSATDNLSGVAATYYNLDNAGRQTYSSATGIAITTEGIHTLSYWSVDAAGNLETAHTVQIKIDKTAPNITNSNNPVPNSAGWNNAPVKITFTCTDTASSPSVTPSGIQSCDGQVPTSATTTATGVTNWSTEGMGQIVTGTAVDNAGNTASDPVSVSIDTTSPTIAVTPSSQPNSNGWYKTPVTYSYTCADPKNATNGTSGSGIASCQAAKTVSTEGLNTSVNLSGTTTDAAGNSTTITGPSAPKIDMTAPTINYTAKKADSSTYTPGAWTNTSSVTLTFTCSDPAPAGVTPSGIPTGNCPAPVTVNTQGTHTVAAQVSDAAGNTTVVNVPVNIDWTAPTIGGSVYPAPMNGWNSAAKGNVIVSFICGDTFSGVVGCPAPTTLTNETGGQPIVGTAYDAAGNSAQATVTVKIDNTPPTIFLASVKTANGSAYTPGTWTTSAYVTATWTCTDPNLKDGSAGSGAMQSTVSQTVSSEGQNQSAIGTCTDRAGNSSHATVSNIDIDRTAPTLYPTLSAAAGLVNPAVRPNTVLLKDSVTASPNAVDYVSGVKSQSCNSGKPIPTNAVGSNLNFTCTATDYAGNQTTPMVSYTVVYKVQLVSYSTVAGGTTINLALENAGSANVGASSITLTPYLLTSNHGNSTLGSTPFSFGKGTYTYFLGGLTTGSYTLYFHASGAGSDYPYQISFTV